MSGRNNNTLTDQRQSEMRSCAQCGYSVTNPFYDRCPRCNTRLPKLDLYCGGCLHRSVCPVLAEQEGNSVRETGMGSEENSHETYS